jgi:hypothetical protein
MRQNSFELQFTEEADLDIQELKNDNSKRTVAKAVVKILKFMRENLKHPSLQTHKFDEFTGPEGQEIFESYVQNNHLELIEFFGIMVLVAKLSLL